MERQIRTTADCNGDKVWLGCTVSFEDRLWKVRNILRTGKRISVVLEESSNEPHSSVTTYGRRVSLAQ